MISKRLIKGEKYITPMDFAEQLRKSGVSEILKFIMINSYKMDFMKGNVILVKVDELYNILKSAGHSLFVER